MKKVVVEVNNWVKVAVVVKVGGESDRVSPCGSDGVDQDSGESEDEDDGVGRCRITDKYYKLVPAGHRLDLELGKLFHRHTIWHSRHSWQIQNLRLCLSLCHHLSVLLVFH